MPTTLEAYGHDSYPYLHVARRQCVPYCAVLAFVQFMDDVRDNAFDRARDFRSDLDDGTKRAIVVAYEQEQRRRVGG